MVDGSTPQLPTDRYFNDPVFHALVHVMSDGGWTDEDGVHHQGPTVSDANRVQRFYDAIDSIGFEIARKRDE